MAMNFWEAQRKAKQRTTYYLIIFFALTFIAAFIAEWAMRTFGGDSYSGEFPYVGLGFLALTFLVAGYNFLQYKQFGGKYVAESVNAKPVNPNTTNPRERQLLNIVEEIAVATSLPIPPVYILEAQEINAFAAGTSPDNAAITVTRGCLNLLNRDELQGVLAHEFGHVYNGDVKIGITVAAMVMGFFIATYIGLKMLQTSYYAMPYQSTRYSSDDRDGRKGMNPILLIAIILLIVGALTWFFGAILQAMVSRQREYLADACSVQFTRNPSGIANALRKIEKYTTSDMPRSAKPFAHMFFNERESILARLFATHPPIEKRIAAIEGREYEDMPSDLKLPERRI